MSPPSPHPTRAAPQRTGTSIRTWLLALVLVTSLPTLLLLAVQARPLALSTAAGAGLAGLALGVLLALVLARWVRTDLGRLAAHPRPERSGRPSRIAEIARLEQAQLQSKRHEESSRERLAARAHALQLLFDRSPAGLAIAQDRGGQQVWHNAAMERLLGTSAQVLHEGQPLPPAAWPLQRAARLGESIDGMELELASPDRASTFVLVSALPLRDERGQACGAVCVLVDISERKRAEAQTRTAARALREQQRLVEQALTSGEVGFFQHAIGTDRMTWSNSQTALFGAPLPGGAGLKDWLARMHDDDRARIEREVWTACALHRRRLAVNYRVTGPGGSERWLSSRLGLAYDRHGHATELNGVTLDVSDARRTEQQRLQELEDAQRALRDAQTASRAKDDLLLLLGHELRNPLGAIASAAEVLSFAPPGSTNAQEAQIIIGRQIVQLEQRLSETLDLGRALSGTLVLQQHPLDLTALLARVSAPAGQGELDGQPGPHALRGAGTSLWVQGDALRLEQAVRHLIDAVQTQSDQGNRVELDLRRSGEWVELVVQAAAGRPLGATTGTAGTRLVLARRLAELHGGNVVADLQAPRVMLRLPAVDASDISNQPLPPVAPASRRSRKVLVVEDNEDVLSALRAKLELDGHSVSTAVDGIAGLDRLLALQPEVSIVDIGLPGLTGYEIARHARAAGYAGRMIALSGFGSGPDADSARVAGFDAYLIKPVNRQQLRACLNEE